MARDAEEVWMSGLPEKYAQRSETPDFEGMCLAEFASEYRTLVLYQSLNETQASIFYTVREWCFMRVWGHIPEQFFYFPYIRRSWLWKITCNQQGK